MVRTEKKAEQALTLNSVENVIAQLCSDENVQ
jgi:hypothetical protein